MKLIRIVMTAFVFGIYLALIILLQDKKDNLQIVAAFLMLASCYPSAYLLKIIWRKITKPKP